MKKSEAKKLVEEKYANFDAKQKKILTLALEMDVDVEDIANPEYSGVLMAALADCKRYNMNTDIFLEPDLSDTQIDELVNFIGCEKLFKEDEKFAIYTEYSKDDMPKPE